MPSSKSNDMIAEMTRPNRLQLNSDTVLPMRRHVRGARSLSPQRHERMRSQYLQGAYGHRQTFSRDQNQLPRNIADANDSLQDLVRSMRDLKIPAQPGRRLDELNRHDTRSSRASLGPRPLKNPSPDPDQSSQDIPRIQAAAMSEEAFEKMIRDGQSFASTSGSADIQIDWARDALRLTERQRVRRQRISPGTSTPLSMKQYELQQDAMNIIHALRSSNNARAQCLYGLLLETGQAAVSIDRRAAFTLYQEASRSGLARADYRIGMQFEKAGDDIKACEHYEYGASKDDVGCLFRLGMIFLLGQCGRQVDQHKGISCLHLSAISADVENPEGAYFWGLILAGETDLHLVRDIPRDCSAGVMFLEKAAALRYPAAQQRLGRAHELNELQCEFSPALSVHYYTLAAEGDEVEADMALSKWFLAGSDDGAVCKDEQKAFFHAELAARRGLATAEFALGYFYEVGVGCAADLTRAQGYYAQAAAHGSEEARSRIMGLARTGTITRKEHEFNISTKIQARHATIKLNQQQAGRYRKRAQSNLPPLHTAEVYRSPRPTGKGHMSHMSLNNVQPLASSPSFSMELKQERTVEKLEVSEKGPAVSQKQRMINDGDPQQDDGDEEHRHFPAKIELGLQQRQPVPNGGSTGPELRNELQIGDAFSKAQHSPQTVQQESQAYGQERIQKWNQNIASTSYPASPNMAPSEVGSQVEALKLKSPRPESSVSNVPPFRFTQLSDVGKTLSSTVPLSSAASDTTAPLSVGAALNVYSSVTTTSNASNRAAATFEEMGIPMVNRKKEDCIIM